MLRVLVLLAALCCAGAGFAQTLMVVSPGDGFLNVRSGPGPENDKLTEIYHGQSVEVLQKSQGWVKIRTPKGKIGWASGKYLTVFSEQKSRLKVRSPKDGFLNLRTGPAARYPVLFRMPHGSTAHVLGRSEDWLKLRHDSGGIGWAHSKYLVQNGAAAQTGTREGSARGTASPEPAAREAEVKPRQLPKTADTSTPTGVFAGAIFNGVKEGQDTDDPLAKLCNALPAASDARTACLGKDIMTIRDTRARNIMRGKCLSLGTSDFATDLTNVCQNGRAACSVIADSAAAQACASCEDTRRWLAVYALGHTLQCP